MTGMRLPNLKSSVVWNVAASRFDQHFQSETNIGEDVSSQWKTSGSVQLDLETKQLPRRQTRPRAAKAVDAEG